MVKCDLPMQNDIHLSADHNANTMIPPKMWE